jgi:ribonucleoside-triphosphate reductase (thioredoxin)
MHVSQEILSDITVFTKYARYSPTLGRRETWEELVTRNKEMHQRKYPQLFEEIEDAYKFVYAKKVLPSMRSLQFGGRSIELNNSRIYNCAYAPVDSIEVFSEAMFLLLGGTGVGYSVQRQDVRKLPIVNGCIPGNSKRFVVGDSIEGWADAVKVLFESYVFGKRVPRFDYSDIRPKGAMLVTSGGKAPGPEPLKNCLDRIERVLSDSVGKRLTTLQCHDIMCHIADAVLAGGIRRAALISLFSMDDEEMLTCKSGPWWEQNPQRGRANNSAVVLRHRVRKHDFLELWKKVEQSGSGEPGIIFTNDKTWGTNPCAEIGLRPFQFCNLCEVNVSDVADQADLESRCKAAAFIGTLQAGYTDFHYLRDIWRDTTEKDALLGVGMTGIASNRCANLNLMLAANVVVEENIRVAHRIGINEAARTTTVKPSGTASLVLGCSSGIHAWHNDYYVRRMRVGKNESIYKYLKENHPELVEDEHFRPEQQAVISVPQKAPDGAIYRTESVFDLLERVKRWNLHWVAPGHRDGQNSHNVSATISIKDGEWQSVGEWMWQNRDSYTGLSVLPYDGGSYIQAPFENISEELFLKLEGSLHSIDLTKVMETEDNTNLQGEAACAGGKCEIV